MVRIVCRALRAGAGVFALRKTVMKLNNKNNAENIRIEYEKKEVRL